MFILFLNREYIYSEIEGCILGNYSNIYPDYFQLKIKGRWTQRLRWKISLVDRKDYPSLIAELNSKGVEVFKKGIK